MDARGGARDRSHGNRAHQWAPASTVLMMPLETPLFWPPAWITFGLFTGDTAHAIVQEHGGDERGGVGRGRRRRRARKERISARAPT